MLSGICSERRNKGLLRCEIKVVVFTTCVSYSNIAQVVDCTWVTSTEVRWDRNMFYCRIYFSVTVSVLIVWCAAVYIKGTLVHTEEIFSFTQEIPWKISLLLNRIFNNRAHFCVTYTLVLFFLFLIPVVSYRLFMCIIQFVAFHGHDGAQITHTLTWIFNPGTNNSGLYCKRDL